MNLFRKNLTVIRAIVLVVVWNFLLTILLPINNVFAQTGPSQAETSGFSLSSTSGMVNKFTGDFNYSIPLMNVEGYPIQISYNQNVGMMSEASWVGLGWNLNVGSVSRNMRGLPDDFNGKDKIKRISKRDSMLKKGSKIGPSLAASYKFGPEKIFGQEVAPNIFQVGGQLTLLVGNYTNSYNGPGTTLDLSSALSFSTSDELRIGGGVLSRLGIDAGIGFSGDSQNGVGRSGNLGLSKGWGKDDGNFSSKVNVGFGRSFHSRSGLTSKFSSFNFSSINESAGFGIGFGGVSSYSYGALTAIPSIHSEMVTNDNSFTLNQFVFKDGAKIYWKIGLTNQVYSSVTDNKTKIDNYESKQNAFGYFHMGKRNLEVTDCPSCLSEENSIMDFNTSTASIYNEEMENLPFSTPTYDLFNISSGGLQGQFRAHRSEVGLLQDNSMNNSAKGNSGYLDAGISITGTKIYIGGGYGQNKMEQTTTSETEDPTISINSQEYSGSLSNDYNKADTNVFLKKNGELTPSKTSMLEDYYGNKPAALIPNYNSANKSIEFDNSNMKIKDPSQLPFPSTYQSVNFSSNQNSYRADDRIRSTDIRMYNAEEAENLDFLQTPRSFNENADYNGTSSPVTRIESGVRKENHISAVDVVDESGMRYIYGTPAYNLKSETVVFSAAGLKDGTYDSTGLVKYTPGTDNSIDNDNGKSGFFEKTTTPSYAHSFLLTEMYSHDYVDRSGNGPTADDVGNYYKVNYSQVYDKNDPFTWRLPVSGESGLDDAVANMDIGFRSSMVDDIGRYEYGEKEVWYTNSVESKNQVAQFYISDRKDGLAVDEDGFIDDTKKLKRLDSIILYNKHDFEENGRANATPLQTVIFKYDYSLCKNYDRNENTYGGTYSESGKLTLKEIRIKSGGSDEQGLYPYQFEYSSVNEEFSNIDVDRWGNYKANNTSYPNTEYPYVDDNYSNLVESAKNWKLTTIISPTQGKISVEYEPDQYRFIQDKKSMRFMKLEGMTSMIDLVDLNNENYSSTVPDTYSEFRAKESQLNGITNIDDFDFPGISESKRKERRLPNNVLVFELDEPYSGQGKDDLEIQFRKDYFNNDADPNNLEQLKEIYVKSRVKVDPSEDKWEDIPTFANIGYKDVSNFNALLERNNLTQYENIKGVGLIGEDGSSQYKYGYVVVALDHINDNIDKKQPILSGSDYQVNTLQKAAWQFSRRHLPELVYADCEYDENTNEFNCDYSNNLDWKVVFGGRMNKVLNRKKFCLDFDPNHTFVRLYNNHDQTDKYASSARVKSITYSDNWNELSGESEATYTWEYQYNGENNAYEGGIAAYEPMLGNDVNPFYQWSTYTNKKNGSSFPDKTLYNEEPIANILFPAPTIGYEEVTVKFSDVNTPNKMGQSISGFITAKDYPTFVDRTKVFKDGGDESNLIKTETYELVGLSQGYVVETNDFHGKPKNSKVLDAGNNPISKTTYEYHGLGDKLPTIDRDGTVNYEELACDYDIYSRRAFSMSKTTSWSLGGGVFIGLSPFSLFPSFNPTFINNHRGIYTNVFHKTIHRRAIVKSIRTQYLDSDNYAENSYYDRHTGNVIVSSLRDEYDDKLYSVNYPAHWYYENFQNRHRATSYEFTGVSVTNGVISSPSNSMLSSFSEGDLLLLDDNSTVIEAIILEKTASKVILIDPISGDLIATDSYDIKIHYPGRKNRLSAMMQSVTTKDDSFLDSGFDFPTDNIISVNAVSFKENKNVYCDGGEGSPIPGINLDPGSTINPYRHGVKGSYRIANSFAFQQSRDQTDPHKTRHSGVLDNYVSFYELVSGEWNKINDADHPDYISPSDYGDYRMLGDMTEYDEFGKPVEAKNQIDVFSSSLYGYSNSLKIVPIAQASNAKQTDIAFDGFEDYDYLLSNSANGHFDFTESIDLTSVSITDTERHSGRLSLHVPNGDEAIVERVVDTTSSCDSGSNIVDDQYEVRNCDCVQDFTPSAGKYVISLWVKEQTPTNDTTYSQTDVRVRSLDVSSTTVDSDTYSPTGPIIDGWQRVEGVFTIPSSGVESLEVKIDATGGVYVDDIRIHPFKSSMVTMVYDKNTLLPLAKHDAYNFTTFYNYDRNLQVRKVRVETVEGIKTVTESESGGKKTILSN